VEVGSGERSNGRGDNLKRMDYSSVMMERWSRVVNDFPMVDKSDMNNFGNGRQS
jgi:hypothetical protein